MATTRKKENILGVDIGGSKINVVVWDGEKIVEQKQIVGAPNKDKLKTIAGEWGLQKIGVGVPGIFDATSGIVIKCSNAPQLDGLNLKKLWPDKTIKIDNDVHCFLLAEAMLGAGGGYNNIVAVAFGTGIGGALMIDGKILPPVAGEVGHIIIDRGQNWKRLYQKTKNNSREQEKINAIGLANLINVLSPEIIILGGKGAQSPNKKIISQYLLLPKKQMPKIILAKLGQNANAIGAALLFVK